MSVILLESIMIAYFRMEATETSTTCHVEVMTTCRRTAVGTHRAKWMITLINVVDTKPALIERVRIFLRPE